MIENTIRNKAIKIFELTALAVITSLFLTASAQAQVFPLPYGFPTYPYFSPIIPSAQIYPVQSAPAFPLSPSLPPTTASIQGVTIYIPISATSFNLGIGIPGFGTAIGPSLKLTSLSAPTTVFIYPSGYVPPPAVPTVVAPSVVAPTTAAPTAIPPTAVVPTTTSLSAAVSGTFLLFDTLGLPPLGSSFS